MRGLPGARPCALAKKNAQNAQSLELLCGNMNRPARGDARRGEGVPKPIGRRSLATGRCFARGLRGFCVPALPGTPAALGPPSAAPKASPPWRPEGHAFRLGGFRHASRVTGRGSPVAGRWSLYKSFTMHSYEKTRRQVLYNAHLQIIGLKVPWNEHLQKTPGG